MVDREQEAKDLKGVVDSVCGNIRTAFEGGFDLKTALEAITSIKLSEYGKDLNQTLTLEVPIVFFAGQGEDTLKIGSIAGVPEMANLTSPEEIAYFQKAKLVWDNQIQFLEIQRLREEIEMQNQALEHYGHFSDQAK